MDSELSILIILVERNYRKKSIINVKNPSISSIILQIASDTKIN